MAAPEGFQIIKIPIVTGLPFTHSLLLQDDQQQPTNSNEILLVGIDPYITSKQLHSSICSNENIKMSKTFKLSRVQSNRMAGRKDVTSLAFIEAANAKQKVSMLQKLTKPDSLFPIPLPVDSIECRLVERLHRYHDTDALQRHVDDHMAEHDEMLEKEKCKEQFVDSEGFTVVTSGLTARSPDGIVVQSFKPKGVSIASSSNVFLKTSNLCGPTNLKSNKRKGGQELDFYRFQVRKQKEEELLAIMRKQEEDQQVVEEMKRRKKFKVR